MKKHPRYIYRSMAICSTLLNEVVRFRRFLHLKEEERQAHLDIPQQFVHTLIQLGPTFIKIGQILSTRPDFLPREYITELQSLQEHVPALSFKEVQATLEAALGAPLSRLFQTLEAQPVASASLAQVHLAVLHDGTEVAVKVQRPGVREIMQEDMAVLGFLLDILARLLPRTIRTLNIVDGFAEFRRYTLQELDFVQEAKTLERFQHNFRDWSEIVIPQVYWDQTTSTVLTMSRVAGARVQAVVEQASAQERRTLTTRILDLEMKMFITDGLFHADLHPGNIFFQQDGKMALLDFGMYGEITEQQRDHFTLYLLAVVQKEVRRAFHHLISLTKRRKGADEAAYYRRFKELAEQFYHSTLSQTSFTQVYLQIFLAGSRYGFTFPGDLLLHAKALTTAEALVLALVPDLKFEEEARPIVVRHYTQRVMEGKRLLRLVQRVLPELLMFGELPPVAVRDEAADDRLADRLWTDVGQAMIENIQFWNVSADLLPLALKPFISQGLGHLYPPEGINDLIDAMKEEYRKLEPSITREPTLGGDLMVHLAAFTIAMYRVLVQNKHSREEATQLVHDITWRAYSKMGAVPWLLSGKVGQESYRRLRFAVDAFLTFPFSSPSYQWEQVDGGQRVYAFNMVRCPVADYFRSQGLSDLCVKTWCDLDFPLARQWGGAHLERTGTLAGGAPGCDFRWCALGATRDAEHRHATEEARRPPASPTVLEGMERE